MDHLSRENLHGSISADSQSPIPVAFGAPEEEAAESRGDRVLLEKLSRTAASLGLPESRVGSVLFFNPDRGWGLLRVIGRIRPLYVNAADILDSDELGAAEGTPRAAFRYKHLCVGQIVAFEVNLESARGPRASRVFVVPEEGGADRFSGSERTPPGLLET